MKSALLFLFKLPFRILALPIVILLFGLEGILNAAESVSGFFIGLYNLLLVAILCLIIYNKEWNQMWGFSIMVVVEGILLAAVGVAHAFISIVKDRLISFMIGHSYGVFVNTDNLVHTARRFSARFPVIECIASAT